MPLPTSPSPLVAAGALLGLLASCGGGGSSGAKAVPATLAVDPAEAFDVAGFQGGPFVPATKDYVLRNAGTEELSWTATMDAQEPWVSFAPDQGLLGAGEETTVRVTIEQTPAAQLAAGLFPVAIDFNNETNGMGTTSRGLNLTVNATLELELEPAEDFSAAGTPGGPFAPGTKSYTLTNLNAFAVNWDTVVDGPWLTVTPATGQLAPGAQVQLTVAIEPTQAAFLSFGTHVASIDFTVNGTSALILDASLSVQSANNSTADALSQYGITWDFDGFYEVGQYANGDWWVVGPVTITGITPESVNAGGYVVNGSMINPSPTLGTAQGFDSTMYAQYKQPGDYSSALNVAFGVTDLSPLVVPTDSSLVSTISRPEPNLRPQLFSAAILTVVDAPPAPGSFRPPYCGTDKTSEFNQSQIIVERLSSLPRVSSTPSMALVERWFQRPWIDHIPDWPGRYAHPVKNMPEYGREIADQTGTAALMLHLDFTFAEKSTLLIRYLQLGIDLFGIVEDGGNQNWLAGGGHHSGRKWPILFAGIVLDDLDMASIGFDDTVAFNEDDQTFYVQETAPGVYNYGQGGYQAQHVGLPDWGTQHWKQINRGQPPTADDVTWFGNPYRICCTAHVWWGGALAAYIMGAKPLWNHDALFDYLDRYRMVSTTTGQAPWTIGWTPFQLEMWDTYRANY